MTRGPFTPESLDRYAEYEAALEDLHTSVAESLEREDIFAAARRIGLLQETEEVSEEELDILMAYAIYAFRRADGGTAIEALPKDTPRDAKRDDLEIRLRVALRSLRFTMLQPMEFVPPYGIEVRDLLRDEQLFLFEPYLSELENKDKDIILTTWVLPLPEFTMTNSALLITAGNTVDRLIKPLEGAFPLLQSGGITAFSRLSPEQQSEAITVLVRTMLDEHLLPDEEE